MLMSIVKAAPKAPITHVAMKPMIADIGTARKIGIGNAPKKSAGWWDHSFRLLTLVPLPVIR